MDYKVKTYDEAVKVIEKMGILPLAPLIPRFPSLTSITLPEDWHSETEFDPWMWRTKFPTDGVAGYGKFIKKESVLVSRQLLPYVKMVLGSTESVEERYYDGTVSKVALDLFKIISFEEGIDTRALRVKAGLKATDKKRIFENALLELQGSMDIVISGIQEKRDEDGKKNGWSSTSFETYDSWATRNGIERVNANKDRSREYLMSFFSKIASDESIKKLEKIFE